MIAFQRMNHGRVEKLGTVGAVIAAAACPVCFPKIALVGAAVGLGIFAPFEGYIAVGVQILFVLALIGQILAFRRHRNIWLISLAIATTVLFFVAYYVFSSSLLLEVSLAGLVIASAWLVVKTRRCATRAEQTDRANADA